MTTAAVRPVSAHRVAAALAVLVLGTVVAGCFGNGDSARLHQQAQAALARWADAVGAAGGASAIVLVGDLTRQVGDWELKVGDNDKPALMAGMVEAVVDLPAKAPHDGDVRWPDGTTRTVQLISAQQALSELKANAAGSSCPECMPLQITAARLTSGTVATSRGPATAPLWEFSVAGTAVRVTRVAIADRVSVVPPPWDPNNAPAGIAIESATASADGRQLMVTFVGAPGPGSQACGADYSGEAVESATAVVVIVNEHRNGTLGACAAVGAERTATVELAAPLGDRAVLEVQQGLPVPVLLSR
jgi:hypothetical protein